MKLFKRIGNIFYTRKGAFVFYSLAATALTFLYSSKWAYAWIAEIYPLGTGFVPMMFSLICLCIIIMLCFFFLHDKIKSRIFRIIYMTGCVLSGALFVYTVVLLFGLDNGLDLFGVGEGLAYLSPNLPYLGLALGIALALVFSANKKKMAQAAVAAIVICAIVITPGFIIKKIDRSGNKALTPISLQSPNLMTGASVLSESGGSLAQNLISDDNNFWSPKRDGVNCFAEIQLDGAQAFNTAIIEEIGNQVQYYRLQALVDGQWLTLYQGEKIQTMRICSFDTVETERIRLSIDKFRDNKTAVKIKSLKLYNEPKRDAEGFEVTVYQRLDGDVPTEILAKGEEYARTYARFYDVYSTVIVFAAVHWDEDGNMNFGQLGEEGFAREIAALKEIISMRSNPEHKVKIIITALADGAWGNGHSGVNYYMAEHWEAIADKIVAFVDKYNFDGVDIDWEYPQSSADWRVYDSFIARLDDGMNAKKPGAIISAALSAWGLGMSEDTLKRLDQIQFMAYDGADLDGYQSSLHQAQEGIGDFIKNGADINKINIGIAAYGRPVEGGEYWATWRGLEQANYWDSLYINVPDSDYQNNPNPMVIYDGAFCSPAEAGAKTAYALMSGAGGVMLFRVGCDKTMDDPNSVALGIENILNRYIANR